MKEIAMMIEEGCSVVQLASWIHDNARTEMTMGDARSSAHYFIKSHGSADYEPADDGYCEKCHEPLSDDAEGYFCQGCRAEGDKKRNISTMNIPDSLQEEE